MGSVTSSNARPKPAASLVGLVGLDEIVTSSELQKRLSALGMTGVGARQAISRAARADGELWRSEALQLQRGERLIARAEFSRSPDFFRAVSERLRDARPGIWRLLDALATEGIVNGVHAHKLLAASVHQGQSRRSPTFAAEIAALAEIGIKVGDGGLQHEYLFSAGKESSPRERETKALSALDTLRRERIVSRLIVERLRQQNVISWNGAELPRGDQGFVTRNGQIFSATAFTFLAPMVRFNKASAKMTPSLVLVDTYAGTCKYSTSRLFSLEQTLRPGAEKRGKHTLAYSPRATLRKRRGTRPKAKAFLP